VDPELTSALSRARELAAQVLRATEVHERPDLEAQISDELARFRNAVVSVVFAGEVKRGKSSLINALVDLPGLLPVGVDVTTNARLAVGWCDVPTASVQCVDGAHEIPIEDLANWASEAGNPGNKAGVVAVAIGVPSPLLASQLVLLDTPGLNSRFPGHQDVALAALGSSDAVVLVVDPDSEITAEELKFLRAATARVGTVVLAGTKSDLPEASAALRNTEAVLVRELPELRAVHAVAVSAVLADLAREQSAAGDDELADTLDADSGIPALRELITSTIAEGATQVRLANLMWVCSRVAVELHAGQRGQLLSLESKDGLAAETEAIRRELMKSSGDENRWRNELRRQLQRVDSEMRAAISRSFLELRHRYQEVIAESKGAHTTPELLEDLDRSLDALYANTHAFLNDQIAVAVASVADALDTQGIVLEALRPAPALRDQLRLVSQRPPTRKSTGEQMLNYMPAIYAPAALGSLVGSAATILGATAAGVSAALAPVAIPVMGGMFLVRARVERRQSGRRHATEALHEALATAKDGPDGLLNDASRALAAIGNQLQERIAARLETRRSVLEEQLRKQAELARAGAVERRSQAAEINQRVIALKRIEDATTA
jgi:signal recognition particle receptor subunit beta